MTSTSPPLEAQRFGRSQTPESPRPVHLQEPSNIPVLQMQMDPVFNDTSTYNIRPTSQPYSSNAQDETFRENMISDQPLARHDMVENFLASAGQSGQFDVPSESPLPEPMSNNSSALTTSPPANATAVSAPLEALHFLRPPGQFHSSPSSSRDTNHDSSAAITQTPTVAQEAPQVLEGPTPLSTQIANDVSEPNANPPSNNLTQTAAQPTENAGDGVDYRSLLEQITQSTSTAPAADSMTAATTASGNQDESLNERVLPTVPGLPPKPPPQDFPNYANEPLKFYSMPLQDSYSSANQGQSPSLLRNADISALRQASPETNAAHPANGLPPIPTSVVQVQHNDFFHREASPKGIRPLDRAQSEVSRTGSVSEGPWGQDVQSMYDQFLADERNYVTEGVWDKFPAGSRLFVGNLPTEKVTKRDLFHVFHRHGRLAQISIKQAYGFVQFLESNACYNALATEQGVEIRGRKIHLEISKPQRNTRNAGSGGGKSNARRRSRSPDRGVTRTSLDRVSHGDRLPFSDFRDEPGRRRDDYRPLRSPSPRGYRARDEYRSRDRSPRLHRPPSPQVFDEDAALPLARRDPKDVPDVQLLVLEEVAPQFINYVEHGFRQKGLRASTTWLNQRLTLAAVVKRQILEGVQAIVKLTRNAQFNSKIPLQVFDRNAGASNVNFLEYVELDIPVAADIVIQARQKERMTSQAPMVSPAQYISNQPFNPQPPYSYAQQVQSQPQQTYHQQMPQSYTQLPPQQNHQQYPSQPSTMYQPPMQIPPTPSSNPPNLQELLANLRQPSGRQQSPQQSPQASQPNRPTDLGSLLSNVAARQHNQSHQFNQPHQATQVQQYASQFMLPGHATQQGVHGYGHDGQPPQQNVQNVMDQLARYNQR